MNPYICHDMSIKFKRGFDPARSSRHRDIAQLAALANWLDSAVRIPGTRITLGFDALIGLVPVLGDTAGLVIGLWVVGRAHRIGVSNPTLLKMLANLAIDYALGAVPLIGDVFDVFWKANKRNVRLLEQETGSH